MSIKAYKGFNKDMTCRGVQFKEGETYEEERAEVCKSGFHACENPIDCLSYYAPNESIYHEVELDGDVSRGDGKDSKIAASRIKIGAKIDFKGMIKASVDFVLERVKATTGDYAHSATTGDYAHSATNGDYAHSATTGDYAHSATTGYSAHSEVKGANTIAAALGADIKARGALGCWIVVSEWETKGIPVLIGVRAGKIDGVNLKPDTWYKLENGEFVEAEDEGE